MRAARLRLGFSREALAVRAGISWSAISQLEGGRRRNLRPSTLAALAGALRVTVDYLVSGEPGVQPMLEHSALLYENEDEFLESAVPFVRAATESSEAALVVASARHIGMLRERLGPRPGRVQFADRSGWGDAPSDALAAFRSFVADQLRTGAPWVRILIEPLVDGHGGTPRRAVGRYEAVLNLAFAAAPLTALCAYDAAALDDELVEQLGATHPHLLAGEGVVANPEFVDPVQFVAGRERAVGEGRG